MKTTSNFQSSEPSEPPSDVLTHVGQDGKASMVDVGGKPITRRIATARGTIFLGKEAFELVRYNNMKKGDVLGVSKIAGIQAAKGASGLIPLCHNLLLSKVSVELELEAETESVVISCTATCTGQTGVEMEALTGVSVAALTMYDMCKAVTREMVIHDIHLVSKHGGQRGSYDKKY